MLALLSLALSADQTLLYDVTVNGQVAGTRTLNIQYFPRPDGERRVVQLVSELKLGADSWHIRATSTSGPNGAAFTASIDHSGALSQVQGVEQPEGGWHVTTSDRGGTRTFTYPRTDARLSSLDLYDPGRTWRLGAAGPFGLLISESGDAVIGQLSEPSDQTLTIAGVSVPVRHYALSAQGGNGSIDLDVNGLMIRSELAWLGMQVVSTVHTAPAPRAVEQIQTIDDMGGGVQEQPL